MKKLMAFLAVGVVLFAACGREGTGANDALTPADSTSEPTASADSMSSAGPDSSAAASSSPGAPGATTAASSAPSTAAAASSAPAKPAAGRANPPKDGEYTYAYNGTATNPLNPGAPPTKTSGTLTNQVSHRGNVYTTETTNSETPGLTTIKTRYSSTKVEMLSLKQSSSAGEFGCTFNPPLVITKFPIKPETYPTQPFKGSGNACNGSLDITIVKKETATDGAGHRWDAWQVKVKTVIKADQLTVTQNETRHVSPDLGVEVRAESATDGRYATQRFTQTGNSVLKTYPR